VTGVTGATGLTGSTGAAATLPSILYRVSKPITTGANLKERTSTEVPCRSGEVAIGGGVTITGGNGIVIAESVPNSTNTGWIGAEVQSIASVAQGGKGAAATFQVWVTCTP
jgi:hypothetical protein